MISNRAASIARAGIMFATTGDPDRPFPSLPDLSGERGTPAIHEHLPYSFPVEDFPGWLLVSVDPTRFHYHDEAAQAMDESNWAVVMGAIGEHYAEEINYGAAPGKQAEYWARNVRDAHDEGAFLVDRVLLVAPLVDLDDENLSDDEWRKGDEHNTRVAMLADLADRLADYPLLDEEDYFEREHEAWCAWASEGGLQYDTVRAMREDDWNEPLVEAIDEAWSDVWPIASCHLNESRGFYGECSPDFHEAIARAIDAGELNEVLAAVNESQHDNEHEGDEHEGDERGSDWFDTTPAPRGGLNADDF